ncbi:glycoside hydrolase family 15 protein [Pedobacter gandavensis]|uniref:glycoside hydrolase family 15 protein n=1 Tax=Pedobacter gandavensis TaxID=2679963 RepID=UPI00247A8B1E|nr:glycoside hydrolase family 15 protein [Pedobacter gandavensis]WGQ11223.1 glycoside hydrolase family 15 protein [Pedobacter gandavensis]
MTERHTYQTGIIGNCAYLAHVNKNTNIDWLCWPRFDSSFVFGGLLDQEKGGEFSILPAGEYLSKQYYLENTNIICTEISNEEGSYRVTDFAPRFHQFERYFKPLMLIRKIEPLTGNPRIKVTCKPVCEYGGRKQNISRGSNHLEFSGDTEDMQLSTNISLSYIEDEKYFALNETKYLILTYGNELDAPIISTAERFLLETKKYWRTWIKHSTIVGFYQNYIIRSALTLKIHQYEDTGAIIAASTTSLPESQGSGRNWDYRYCWMRDTYYVITSLNHIGHFEEMEKYFNYITDLSFRDEERYQPLFGIAGERVLTEHIVPDLKGYLGNTPIRIGNQAFEHIQNDIYGQVLISMLPLYTDKRFIYSERKDSEKWLDALLKKIEHTIDEKDAGIWEFRNLPNTHCYTNLFQWAGANAALKMAKTIDDKPLQKRAQLLIDKAAQHIEDCYDPVRKVYTHAVGSPYLDSSTLQLILMNYLDPNSQRAKDHLSALEAELKGANGLFYRYIHTDDFGKPKTTFLICAFWYVEALACVGRLDDAIREFESIIKYSNHLLLFSEDVDEVDGGQWGNFPQAYSHVGLMNAAHRIAVKLDRPSFL